MRTRVYACLITIVFGVLPVVGRADDASHRKAAETLLMVTDTEKHLQQLAAQVLDGQLKQNPQLAPHRDVFQRFLNKYFNWDSLKAEVITVYTQEFTEKELKQLTDFYKTPVGKKASEKMPRLAFAAGELGLQRAQANQAELRQMLEEAQSKPQQ